MRLVGILTKLFHCLHRFQCLLFCFKLTRLEAILQSLIDPGSARHPAKLEFGVQETALQLKEHRLVPTDFFQNLPVFTAQQIVVMDDRTLTPSMRFTIGWPRVSR